MADGMDHHLARNVCPGVRTAAFLGLAGKNAGWQVFNILAGKATDYEGGPLPDDVVQRACRGIAAIGP